MTGLDFGMLGLLLGVAVAAGVVGDVLAGLLGVGGGIMILPDPCLALSAADLGDGISMQIAVATSLATIVFTAWSSSRTHCQRGAVEVALLRRWAPWVVVGVTLGSLLGPVIDGRVMLAIFAGVASLVALNMPLGRGNPSPERRQTPYAARAATGVLAGGTSTLTGIAGGTVCVPVLSTLGYVNLVAVAVITPFTTAFAKLVARTAHAIPLRALRMCFGLFLAVIAARKFIDLATAA